MAKSKIRKNLEIGMDTTYAAVVMRNDSPTWVDTSGKIVVYMDGQMFVEGDGTFEVKGNTLAFKELLDAKNTTL